MPTPRELKVVIEVGQKKVFASAIHYPGWARSAKTETLALEQLLAYRNRYAAIASLVDVQIPSTNKITIVERVTGNATTDFGAPAIPTQGESKVLSHAQQSTLDLLVGACQLAFDRVVAGAPETLRKGPRGGGRETSKIATHVADVAKVYEHKCAKGEWSPAYTARRFGWHLADHLWEIEDRS